MLKACNAGCIAITGNEKPEMEKDTTPHREQALRASRNVGNTAMRNTPKACEATTHNNVANRSGPMPLWHGKPNTP